jgi:hypothetical protein
MFEAHATGVEGNKLGLPVACDESNNSTLNSVMESSI